MTNNKVTLHDLLEINNEILDKMDKMRIEIMVCVKDNEVRVTALEYWKANLMGKITVAIAMFSILTSIIIGWIKKQLDL